MKKDLERLLKRNVEGYRGYALAAEDISNEKLKSFLETYAERKKQFIEELEKTMVRYDIEPVEYTSFLGDLHRAVMKIKESLSSNKDKALLSECARGESMALADYDKVLSSNDLPEDVLKIVMKQRDKAMAGERSMRELATLVEN